MPITKSAQKALRQSERRRIVNKRRNVAMKEEVKRFKKLVAAKQAGDSVAAISKLFRAIDKAAKGGKVIKKNTASRMKSRLTGLLQQSR